MSLHIEQTSEEEAKRGRMDTAMGRGARQSVQGDAATSPLICFKKSIFAFKGENPAGVFIKARKVCWLRTPTLIFVNVKNGLSKNLAIYLKRSTTQTTTGCYEAVAV